MNRMRIVVLAPDVNPDGVSVPFVAYYHATALAWLGYPLHLVPHRRDNLTATA
ncbi:MAG: hypothetical protein WA639_09630 [Candidatus Acidiferrum sp.]